MIRKIFMILAVSVLVLLLFACGEDTAAKYDGQVTIFIVSDEETLEREINFKEGDNLVDLLIESFDLKENENYTIYYFNLLEPTKGSIFITKIAFLEPTGSSYISILVNGTPSMVGLSDIQLEDGLEITFILA